MAAVPADGEEAGDIDNECPDNGMAAVPSDGTIGTVSAAPDHPLRITKQISSNGKEQNP